LRDTVELELAGIPAVAVLHEAFGLAAAAAADVSGLPDCAWVEVAYPTPPPGEWSDAEVASVARTLAPAVLAELRSR